jgi:hypothetical protein
MGVPGSCLFLHDHEHNEPLSYILTIRIGTIFIVLASYEPHCFPVAWEYNAEYQTVCCRIIDLKKTSAVDKVRLEKYVTSRCNVQLRRLGAVEQLCKAGKQEDSARFNLYTRNIQTREYIVGEDY